MVPIKLIRFSVSIWQYRK